MQGAYKDQQGNCSWWLRSPGPNSLSTTYVNSDGSINDIGYYVNNDWGGVRPALWINLESTNQESILTSALQFTDTEEKIIPEQPAYFSYSYDYTSEVLDKQCALEITKDGKKLYSETGAQAIVLVVKSLEGLDPQIYGMNVINEWGIGSKEQNNGILLVLAVDDQALQISTGSGIDMILNDAVCGDILDENMSHFSEGKYGEGLVAIYHDICDYLISALGV